MKLPSARSIPSCRSATRRGGSTVLIILVLLAAMAIIISANSDTLHLLKQELKQIDARQQKKYVTEPGR